MTFRLALMVLAPVVTACAAPTQYVNTEKACAAIGRAADQMGIALSEAVDSPECPARVKSVMLVATQYASEAHAACFIDPEVGE